MEEIAVVTVEPRAIEFLKENWSGNKDLVEADFFKLMEALAKSRPVRRPASFEIVGIQVPEAAEEYILPDGTVPVFVRFREVPAATAAAASGAAS